MQSGVRVRAAGAAMAVESLDAGVVCLGAPTGFPIGLNESAPLYPWAPPEVATHGFASVLFNNLWGTNCTPDCVSNPRLP